MLKPHLVQVCSLKAIERSLKYSKGFNGFRAFISFLYIFYKRFKPQYSLAVFLTKKNIYIGNV